MMQRRRTSKGGEDGGSSTTTTSHTMQVPMGGDLPYATTQTRRRRKKAQSTWRSCLIRLRILGDKRKKLDGLNVPAGTSKRRNESSSCFGSCLSCLVGLGLVSLVVFHGGQHYFQNSQLMIRATTNIPMEIYESLEELRPLGYGKELPVVIFEQGKPKKHKQVRKFEYPHELHHRELREADYVDFGGIDLKLLASEDQKRQIYIMVEDLQNSARSLDRERDDDMEMYWAFDDDIERNPYNLYDTYIPEKMDGRCRRLPWHRYNLPSCNSMHELDLVSNTPRFVGDGAYREVFVTEQPYMGGIQEMIFKELRWDLEMGVDDYEYVRMDAFVTERFTSNKQIVDIYGYCGLSMVTEYFPYGDIEKDVVGFQHHRKNFNPLKDEVLRPLNNFTGAEKLQLALNMVEPVAALHNYPGGVIVHDDIQLCQYLWTDEEGINVKLNDFNRAEIMLWDEIGQRYCKYKNGRGHGDWRAPEEYKDQPLDEKIDIWSLGNNMYSVLTGVYPFFNVEKDRQIQKLIKDGETAVIDPRYVDRSFAESKLIEIIQRCFVYNPDLRADINEIWQMLKDAIAENEIHEKEEARKKAEDEVRRKQKAAAKAEAKAREKARLEEEARAREEAERREREEREEAERREREAKEAQRKAEVLEAQRRAKENQRESEEAAQKRTEAEAQRKREVAREQAEAEQKAQQERAAQEMQRKDGGKEEV